MGVCLNKKYITNNLLDNNSLIDNQSQEINNDKNINKDKEKKSEMNININLIENDINSSMPNKYNLEKNKIITNNDKIFSYQIQSKYKTKFLSISHNNCINNSINSIEQSYNTSTNNDAISKLIFFTNLKDKKVNGYTSTASNSNLK